MSNAHTLSLEALRAYVRDEGRESDEATLAGFFRSAAFAAETDGFDTLDIMAGMVAVIARLLANEPGLEPGEAGTLMGADIAEAVSLFQSCPPEGAERH